MYTTGNVYINIHSKNNDICTGGDKSLNACVHVESWPTKIGKRSVREIGIYTFISGSVNNNIDIHVHNIIQHMHIPRAYRLIYVLMY